MICLSTNDQKNEACRETAKEYLGCRMEHGLMAKEEWNRLGYGDLDKSQIKPEKKD